MEFQNSAWVRPTHRPDIDGLRAVAVLSVVFYHALPLWLPGGFIGVDVFFVISGFLITGLILDNLTRGTFTFIDFYVRRVKRIFPALLVVLATCMVCAWLVLLDDEYAQLGRHVAAGASFVSNLMLWSESGYFDNASATKPLLHLWSLGIEEQFYLLWPALVCLAVRRHWNFPLLVLGLLVLSFAANVERMPHDAVAVFFSPLTRFWELFSGALLAWHTRRESPPKSRHYVALLGAGLIFASLFMITAQRPFPGWWGAMPVLGAVLVIAGGPQAWFNRVVLSSSVPVWFGLISYPLYLWHWPLMAYVHLIGSEAPSVGLALSLAALAVVLAWLTYRVVEMPIRFGTRGPRPAFILALLMIVMASIGLFIDSRQGFPARPFVQDNKTNSTLLKWNYLTSAGCHERLGTHTTFCLELGNPEQLRIAVLGDSTANALAPGLYEWIARDDAGVLNVGSYGCPPFRGLENVDYWKRGTDCVAGMARAFEWIAATPSIKVVVLGLLASNLNIWGIPGTTVSTPQSQRFAVVERLLDADIRFLVAAGKKVVVTYDMPYSRISARRCVPRPFSAWLVSNTGDCDLAEKDLVDRQPYQAWFDKFFSGRDDVCVLRQSDLLMRRGRFSFIDGSGRLLLRDDHHLSTYGSARVAELLAEQCDMSSARP